MWSRHPWGGVRLEVAAPLLVAALLVVTGVIALRVTARAEGVAVRGNAEHGEELFGKLGCNGCHTIHGIGGQVGPDLSRVVKLDLAKERPGKRWPSLVAYIRESLQDPQAYIVLNFPRSPPMPTASQFELSASDIDDLIAYLFSVAEKADGK